MILAWELARKDLRLFLADRRGAFLCFAVPILLASAFGAIFQRPAAPETVRLQLVVVAEDDSPLTARVADALCASPRLEAIRLDRSAALRRLDDQGKGVAVVMLPGFGHAADFPGAPGSRPGVQLLHHPASAPESYWAEGLFTEIALREIARDWLAPLAATHSPLSLERPFAVERTTMTGGHPGVINSYSHSFCGMTLQYLLFWGMDSGLLLLRERRRGTWRRVRAAPVALATVVAGKVLATALVALAQIAVTFAFGRLVFGVTVEGSAVGFATLALAAALLSAASGLLVAALGANEERARSLAVLAILTLSMLGGLWLPSFLLPGWVRRLALAVPTTWAVRGFEGVTWQGMGFVPALQCAGITLGFSVIFLVAACRILARSEVRLTRAGGKG